MEEQYNHPTILKLLNAPSAKSKRKCKEDNNIPIAKRMRSSSDGAGVSNVVQHCNSNALSLNINIQTVDGSSQPCLQELSFPSINNINNSSNNSTIMDCSNSIESYNRNNLGNCNADSTNKSTSIPQHNATASNHAKSSRQAGADSNKVSANGTGVSLAPKRQVHSTISQSRQDKKSCLKEIE